jgi:DnaJ domain
LEEDEELALHIEKLQQETTTPAIENIITLLQQTQYGKTIAAIDEFINNNNQLTFYIDPEIEALRFEAKGLEKQIQELSNEKAELDKLIHEFSVRHNQELGELILKILQHRKQQYKDTPQQEETAKDYEEFYNDYQTTKDEKVATLNEDEQKEIKEKYRKASKLCHPDVVDEAQKEMAHKIFMELNEAYEKNDLQRVTEILESLQQGKAFTSKADTANEKLALQIELERLRQRLQDLNNAISTIKTSEPFEKITSIKDWDEYFENTKQQLQEQLNQLENKE